MDSQSRSEVKISPDLSDSKLKRSYSKGRKSSVFPVLAGAEEIQVSPIIKSQKKDKLTKAKISSEFIAEMTMSLTDRLALCGKQSETPQIIKFEDIGENSYNKETIVPVDQPLFHCLPSKVVFQGYKAFESYEAIISFRNRDKVLNLK